MGVTASLPASSAPAATASASTTVMAAMAR